MSDQVKTFWTTGALIVIAVITFGCVEVGGGGSTSGTVEATTTSNSEQPESND